MNVLLCIVKLLNCWHGHPTSVQRISWQSIYFEKMKHKLLFSKREFTMRGSLQITGCSLNEFPVFCKICFLSFLGSTKYPLPPSKVDFFKVILSHFLKTYSITTGLLHSKNGLRSVICDFEYLSVCSRKTVGWKTGLFLQRQESLNGNLRRAEKMIPSILQKL